MERSLGLIGGAGVLPARMASEARRQGWRVVAFVFGDAEGVDAQADRVVPSRLTHVEAAISALRDERISAAVFAGKFHIGDVLRGERGGGEYRRVIERVESLRDVELFGVVTGLLERMGIEVLDQRRFLGDWIDGEGCWSARRPDEGEWTDVRRGLGFARTLADAGIGQTVVIRRGVVTAAEAAEGTTDAVRRGVALAGPGAVVVKAVARQHDYRFDTPAIGPDTVEAAAAGGAAVLAVEAHRVLIVDKDEAVRRADAGSLGLLSIAEPRV